MVTPKISNNVFNCLLFIKKKKKKRVFNRKVRSLQQNLRKVSINCRTNEPSNFMLGYGAFHIKHLIYVFNYLSVLGKQK